MRTEEGSPHDGVELVSRGSEDASYLITSEWSDGQAFQDFIHSQPFNDIATWGKDHILSSRPQHKSYGH